MFTTASTLGIGARSAEPQLKRERQFPERPEFGQPQVRPSVCTRSSACQSHVSSRGGVHFVVLDACFRDDGKPYERKNSKWTDSNIPAAQGGPERDGQAGDRVRSPAARRRQRLRGEERGRRAQ